MLSLFCHEDFFYSTFCDFSQLEVVVGVEGIICPVWGLTCWGWLALVFLLLGQRARQEPERDAGDEQESRRHQEAHPPGTHPAGIFWSDGHTFCMKRKEFPSERTAGAWSLICVWCNFSLLLPFV